jgi:UDP-N-acetylmuramoyl-tripeptide--D-alanyl-D-alanine ligase
MRARVREFLALTRTPLGRGAIRRRFARRLWPVVRRLAGLYRRTLLRRTRVVVVVGSFGKTTTTRAVGAALCGQQPRVRGNAFAAVSRAVFSTRPGTEYAVFEVGIGRPGQMAPYASMLRPDVVVVTSIGSEHRRSFPTLEDTREEKVEMVRALRPGGIAVLNGDDPHVRWMAGQTTARVVTFGFGPRNDVRAADHVLDWPEGTRFTLHAGGEIRPARVRLIGRHTLYAPLAAAAVAGALGRDLGEALAGLERVSPPRHRLRPQRLENGAFLLCDELKSPLETIEAALETLAQIPARRRIVVLGDVTEPPTVGVYRELGASFAGSASIAVLVGQNGRRYSVGARRAGMPPAAILQAGESFRRAAALLPDDLGPGDVVLVKGRETQHLERIGLLLAGQRVGCELVHCGEPAIRCERCPMLERGWGNRRSVR